MKYAPEIGMEVIGTPLEIMGSASYEKLQERAASFVENFIDEL